MSSLSAKERHDVIINYLSEIKKEAKVFHLRWRPGELLNGKILRSTPMFWYMKYEWSRQEIETMFFKSQIEIDALFDSSLQQVFGGKPGPRWNSNSNISTQKKWRQRHIDNVNKWKAQTANKIDNNENENEKKSVAIDNNNNNNNNLVKNKLSENIAPKSNEIWNAISDFGADKCIDYKIFSDNLSDRGINVSPFLAKQLFDQLAKPSGTISKQGMQVLIKQLDNIQLANNFTNITWDDMATKLGAQLVMKRILGAAGTCEPFNVDDFIFSSKLNVEITPVEYMNKLTHRDVHWNDRVRAMEELSANIGTNPLFNDVLASYTNIGELLCGWSTQILDNKPQVQKTAIQLLPNIFHTTLHLSQGSPQSTVNHLEQILSNLFNVLDDPKAARNHQMIKDVIDKIIDEIIQLNEPESILFLAGILSEKCDLQNSSTPQARLFALTQMKKIMFDENDGIIIPKQGSVRREWLDIAANKQMSPVVATVKTNNIARKYKRRVPPFAVLISYPKQTFINDIIDFDASKSYDGDNKPCVEFAFDFGDATQIITQKSPVIQHKYAQIGQYDVKVVVRDSQNQTATAMVVQRVIIENNNDNNLVDNKEDDESKYNVDDNDLDTLGQQFRVVVSNAFGMVFEDPNKDIAKEGKKLIDVMKQLNPKWIDLLDGTVKKKYVEMEFDLKPYEDKKTMNEPIRIKGGKAEEHEIKNVININIVSQYPDI